MAIVEALAKVPLNGEEPVTRVEITRVRIVPPRRSGRAARLPRRALPPLRAAMRSSA